MLHRAWIAASAVAMVFNAPSSEGSPPPDPRAGAVTTTGCLIAGDGYLRARLRGTLDLDIDWKDAQMQCEGGPRPSGNGVRVSIGGPIRGEGRRIRIVFGVGGISEGRGGENLRTNVTILFEGEQRVFATLGDDKCTVDSLSQQRVETLDPKRAIYRVEARGFCLGPATSLSRDERVLLTSFDFAGRVEFGHDDRHEPKPPNP